MPELPEVETTCRGISPYLLNQTITGVVVRQAKLRFEIPSDLNARCTGQVIRRIARRAKYLLFELSEGYLLNHLGMSGHLMVVGLNTPVRKHDHFDLLLSNGFVLRYNDPRRFGLWLHFTENPASHRLLAHLGPEPLSLDFDSNYLQQCAHNKNMPVKNLIMHNEVVVGVGNIYATESLFLAGIHPLTPAKCLNAAQCDILVQHIKTVLQKAIAAGGTTLRDFYNSEGKPGYFSNELAVYGRKNKPCMQCKTLIQTLSIGNRASAFCPSCQKESVIPL
ncbi:MAG: bifunctional DNA-formamidopyrimidine glycosylase/DNA-(apurinic or apyrimidinic site) lyase [Tatlockia sp.]|jgi:formamidopyrimidine-DNA glycosylase